MGKTRERFSDEVFSVYGRLRKQPKVTQADIGRQMRELFPEVFGKVKTHSVIKLIHMQAEEYGVKIPHGKPGGRPRKIPENDSRWRDQNPVLVFPFSPKVIVLSDVHFPLHSPEYLVRAIQTIRAREIETVVFNGDVFDNGYKGHSGRRSHWNPDREDGLDSFAYFYQELVACPSLKRIVSLCGNHDDKPWRDTDREMEFVDYWAQAIHGIEHPKGLERLITNRYYAYMEPKEPKAWPFEGPHNFPSKFTHQMEYTKFHGRVEDRLAVVDYASHYAGHHHHLSVGRAQSGLLYAVGCGTGQQPDLAAYKNARPSTHPAWNLGFVTIEHGDPHTWFIDSSEEWWRGQLGEEIE
jgi:predicted phosphodiesterase